MMALLSGSGSEFWPRLSYWCTLFKLALLIAGPAYALLGAVFWLAARPGRA